MQTLDWIIVAAALLLVVGFGIYTQQFMTSVSDFLSAGRCARRYLLALGKSEMGAGAVIYVALFEAIYNGGLTNQWWGEINGPIGLVIAIMGFVIYRYRETRAMTLGQFFEIRYSKPFRNFAGLLGVFAGIINFCVMPNVNAHLMVYFFGLPPVLHFNGMTVQTYVPLMGLFLLINVIISSSGGIITIIMTNFIEGLVSQIFYVCLIIGLFCMFKWSQIEHTLIAIGGVGKGTSMINPMDASNLKDFNIWMVIMSMLIGTYGTMAWQNQSAYSSAPLTAHESVMSSLWSRWLGWGRGVVVMLLGVCAMTFLNNPDFAVLSSHAKDALSQIGDPDTQKQMTVPIAVLYMLPVGLKGALCACMLLGVFGGDSSHIHSWSSIFVQDVVLPGRKKPLTPKEHIFLLRCSMVGIALFAFLLGAIFDPHQYILFFWTITTSVFVGGAGVAIIGGLYWKKGTAAAAWSGMVVGSTLSLIKVITDVVILPAHNKSLPKELQYHLPFNSVEATFVIMLIAITTYVIVSLLTCKEDFNMDRMLHRGVYANITKEVGEVVMKTKEKKVTWGKLIGYNDNFTLSDKWVAIGLFVWAMTLSLFAIVGTIWNLIPGHAWALSTWSEYWYISRFLIPALVGIFATIWFSIYGVRDAIDFFKRLKAMKTNPLDNGSVVNHQNLDESVLPDAVSPLIIKADPPVVTKS